MFIINFTSVNKMTISNLEQAFYTFCRVDNPSETKLSLDNFVKVSNDFYKLLTRFKVFAIS